MQETADTLTIRSVSRKFNITPHTLRFWEKELNGILVPLRTEGGQRRYTEDHLSIIAKIKKLKREGLTLAKIRKKFETSFDSNDNPYNQKIDLLADEIAETVRCNLQHP